MELVYTNGTTLLDCILRIVCACFCGAVIGFERSRRKKEAGLRTHIIVCMGAALIMVVSKYGFFDVMDYPNNSFSGDRVAANIITGVSFLGAGMIFYHGNSVKGLTTAAGVWTTAGVGMTIGAGMYIIAGVSTLLIVILQLILHKWHVGPDTKVYGRVIAVLENDEQKLLFIATTLKRAGIELISSEFEKLENGKVKITYHVHSPSEVTAQQSLQLSRIVPEIVYLDVNGNM